MTWVLVACIGLLGNLPAAHGAGQEAAIAPNGGSLRVLLRIGNAQAVVTLDDNPASRDFLALLPLTLTFEDFNSTEKIGNLPRKLKTHGAPTSCDPDVGSFTYYIPWGNLAIFYRDFRYSHNLVPLGRVTSGMEALAAMRDGTSVRLEKME